MALAQYPVVRSGRLSNHHVMIRFDPPALFAALDSDRAARGATWSDIASETGVSVTTIRRLRHSGRFEVDGVLALARWLDRPVADFTRNTAPYTLKRNSTTSPSAMT